MMWEKTDELRACAMCGAWVLPGEGIADPFGDRLCPVCCEGMWGEPSAETQAFLDEFWDTPQAEWTGLELCWADDLVPIAMEEQRRRPRPRQRGRAPPGRETTGRRRGMRRGVRRGVRRGGGNGKKRQSKARRKCGGSL